MSIHTRVVNGPLPARSRTYKARFEGGGPWSGIEGNYLTLPRWLGLLDGGYERDRCEGEFAIYKWQPRPPFDEAES